MLIEGSIIFWRLWSIPISVAGYIATLAPAHTGPVLASCVYRSALKLASEDDPDSFLTKIAIHIFDALDV